MMADLNDCGSGENAHRALGGVCFGGGDRKWGRGGEREMGDV